MRKALETVKNAIAQLTPDELIQFREWFAERDGTQKSEHEQGVSPVVDFDELANEALAIYRSGKPMKF